MRYLNIYCIYVWYTGTWGYIVHIYRVYCNYNITRHCAMVKTESKSGSSVRICRRTWYRVCVRVCVSVCAPFSLTPAHHSLSLFLCHMVEQSMAAQPKGGSAAEQQRCKCALQQCVCECVCEWVSLGLCVGSSRLNKSGIAEEEREKAEKRRKKTQVDIKIEQTENDLCGPHSPTHTHSHTCRQ